MVLCVPYCDVDSDPNCMEQNLTVIHIALSRPSSTILWWEIVVKTEHKLTQKNILVH